MSLITISLTENTYSISADTSMISNSILHKTSKLHETPTWIFGSTGSLSFNHLLKSYLTIRQSIETDWVEPNMIDLLAFFNMIINSRDNYDTENEDEEFIMVHKSTNKAFTGCIYQGKINYLNCIDGIAAIGQSAQMAKMLMRDGYTSDTAIQMIAKHNIYVSTPVESFNNISIEDVPTEDVPTEGRI